MYRASERVPYAGATPGADSSTYNLYSTAGTGTSAGYFQRYGFSRLVVDIKCNYDFTLKWYKSADRGTTWLQLDQEAITAPSSTQTIVRDFLVEPYADFKLDFVNGGSAQSTFAVDMVLTNQRVVAS